MTTHLKQLTTVIETPLRTGELVVIPSVSLEERAVAIRQAHNDVAAAILTAVERALDAGLQLKAAKDEIPHGRWNAYVTRCGLSMSTAQNYMRLAKQEPEVRQLLAEKAQGNVYLTMAEALKYIAKLEAKKKPKRRAVPKRSRGLSKLLGFR